MQFTSQDIEIMARTLYGEVRGEPWDGKVAVAWVIRNRAESDVKRWQGGVAAVCLSPKQFSCWNAGDPNRPKLLAAKPAEVAFRECLAAAAWVLGEAATDPTHGSLNYYAAGIKAPGWALGRTPVKQIGNHVFFNDIQN